MKNDEKKDNPKRFDVDDLKNRWNALIEATAAGDDVEIGATRIRHQAEVASSYGDVLESWEGLSEQERETTWDRLTESVAGAAKEMLPMCVQCGACCQQGSPTLMEDDLELLRAEQIPWSQLFTLRVGEPAHSSITDEVFYLPEEHIKVKERPGTKTCVFYDPSRAACLIHVNRLMQCRAQECWDEEPGKLLAKQDKMTRRGLFESAGLLLEMIEEHDKRFPFSELRALFDELRETKGQSAGKLVDFLAHEEHYRNFVAEKLNIPEDTLDLVFGRPLSGLVRLFGFEVIVEPDGTKVLRPESKEQSKEPTQAD